MKQNMYSVYDSAAGAFMQPFFAVNDGMAIRAFSDAANSDDTNIAKHPDHFSLFRIGTWSDSDGKVEGEVPVRVILAVEAVDREIVSASHAAVLDEKIDKLHRNVMSLMQAVNVDGENE